MGEGGTVLPQLFGECSYEPFSPKPYRTMNKKNKKFNIDASPKDKRKFNPKALKTNICQRCRCLFYPTRPYQEKCVYCVGLPPKKSKSAENCSIKDCPNKIGDKGAKGFCAKHYSQLVRWPRQKAALAEKRKGYKICRTFENCEIYFKPGKNTYHNQLYCNNCKHK